MNRHGFENTVRRYLQNVPLESAGKFSDIARWRVETVSTAIEHGNAEMRIVKDIEQARAAVTEAQRADKRVGLVPTMGALHEGHLSLVRAARERCEVVAVTIFVNPMQFGPDEDFDKYPRPLEMDLAACDKTDVDLVFTPDVEKMYPGDAVTTVHVDRLTAGLCGAHRPIHFDGVTTVVMKLFHILPADMAFFGEKDYQQLVVIRQMARDMNLATKVVGCETVREPDGLAMSSRNAYLSAEERMQALSISQGLRKAQGAFKHGERTGNTLRGIVEETMRRANIEKIDYIEVVNADSLTYLDAVESRARLCVAAHVGRCRLIDNIALE